MINEKGMPVGPVKRPQELLNPSQKILASLFEPGAPNFRAIADVLPSRVESLDSWVKLQEAATNKVMEVLEGGHFRDLDGAKELFAKLGIKDIRFAPETVELVKSMADKFTEYQLMGEAGLTIRFQPKSASAGRSIRAVLFFCDKIYKYE